MSEHPYRPYWIGVDLDGTLAYYDEHQWSEVHIGIPIPRMVARVKAWRAQGIAVRIMTARATNGKVDVIKAIEDWCLTHLGEVLPVTCAKDYGMIELWDDRCVQVAVNSGVRMDGLQ